MHSLHPHALVVAVLVSLSGGACLAEERAVLQTDDQRTVYALGAQLGRQVEALALDPVELRALQQGLADAARGRELEVDPLEHHQQIISLRTERAQQAAAREREASRAFLEAAAREPGALRLDSGLVYTEVRPGEGASPTPTSRVKVHYHGTLRDGSVFDSSRTRGEPATFLLRRVVKCWTEGLQRMRPGGSSTLVCPASIAYGDRGFPPKIRPGAAIRFEVELLEIVR